MNRNFKLLSGFTLIELVVAVAILAVITGMGVASYTKFQGRKNVSEAALFFATTLRGVQKQADSGDVSGCPVDKSLNYYNVYRVSDEIVEIRVNCEGDEIASNQIDISDKYPSVKLSESNPFELHFLTLGRGTNLSSDLVQELFGDPDVGVRYKVTINTGGAITVEEV